jgi:hypothetical protein
MHTALLFDPVAGATMFKKVQLTRVALLAAILSAAAAGTLAAQPIWMERTSPALLSAESLFPGFRGSEELTAVLAHLSARVPLSDAASLVVDLPYASVKYGLGVFGDVTESGVGNPYIGVELGAVDDRVFGEFGARFSFRGEDALGGLALAGVTADFDRAEAFIPDILAIQAAINFRGRESSGLAFHLRAEPVFLIYTGDSDDVFGDTEELLLGYTGMIGYETAQLSIMGGVTGRALITESDLDFGERTTHQLSFRRGVLWCPRLAHGNGTL